MKVSVKKVNDVLGIEVPTDDIMRIMKNLDFAPVLNGDELTINIPAYREDMESYPDVAEEVIRIISSRFSNELVNENIDNLTDDIRKAIIEECSKLDISYEEQKRIEKTVTMTV